MKAQVIRTLAGFSVLLFFLPFTASPGNRAWANPFQMRVVDEAGHQAVPRAKLTSDNGIVCYTKADGSVLRNCFAVGSWFHGVGLRPLSQGLIVARCSWLRVNRLHKTM